MSNYNNTKATIAANVYTNHANQVTAEMVKTAINAVVDTIIAGGFLYKGVAIPTTNPGSPDANVAYIAATAGTYTNFGGLVVADGEVAVLKYNGSWSKEVTGAATAAQVSELGHEVDYVRGKYPYQFSSLTLTPTATGDVLLLNLSPGDVIRVTPNTDTWFVYALLNTFPNLDAGEAVDITPNLISGGGRVATTTGYVVVATEDCHGMIIQGKVNNSIDRTPTSIEINGISVLDGLLPYISTFVKQTNEEINELGDELSDLSIFVSGLPFERIEETENDYTYIEKYVAWSDGSFNGSTNWKLYAIENKGIYRITAKLGAPDTNAVAIAFYNGTPGADTFMRTDSIQSVVGVTDFDCSVPQGCKYIAIGSYTPTLPSPTFTLYEIIEDFVHKDDFNELKQTVNELQYDESIPVCAPLTTPLNISFEYLFDVVDGYGDSECYDGKLFQFINKNTYVYVHDMTTGALIQTITMPNPKNEYHNNSVAFGVEKYDAADEFPLLYASQENPLENKCIVYRITGTIGNYTLSVVQEITFPTNNETGLYYHNCYIDNYYGHLVISGLINQQYSPTDGNSIQYLVFNLPSLSDGNVTLTMDDVLQSSIVFNRMPTTQGAICKNGLLYHALGVLPPQKLMVLDLSTLRFVASCLLTAELRNGEPEGVFDYGGKIHIVYADKDVFRIDR